MEPDLALLSIAVPVFFTGGIIKGLIGVGLPTLAVALLINFMPLHEALALVILPGLVSNIAQAVTGGHALALIRRFWLFALAALVFTWGGVAILASADPGLMKSVFALILSIYALTGLFRPAPPELSLAARRWLALPAGAINGILNGITGSYMLPSVMYFQASGLNRHELVQAMGLFFLASSAVLGLSLAGQNLAGAVDGLTSALSVAPALLGYYIGQKWRGHLDEAGFRKMFFSGLLLLGGYMLLQGVW